MNSRRKLKLKGIIENVTAIHGFGYLRQNRGIKLYIWIFVMVLNFLGTVQFIMIARQKYLDEQIVTEVDSNCRVSEAPFPAVSICNVNIVSLKEAQNIINILQRYGRTDEEITEFLQTLPVLKNYRLTSHTKMNFTEIMAILKRNFFTIDTIMEEVHQTCEELLIFCSFNRKQRKCINMFKLIKTTEGFCCTFNYAALIDVSENPMFTKDDDFEYYDYQSEDKATSLPLVATSETGRQSGLFVVLNVQPEDYPPWSLEPFYGAKVLITDPTDYPETTIKYRYVAPGESIAVKVEPLIVQTDPNLRHINPSKRNCWFHDEVALGLTDRYSFETCQTECKMDTFKKLCNCLPYKYPRDKNVRICDFEDMECLHNVTVYTSRKERKCRPFCYAECNDKKYSISSDTVTFGSENISANITRDHKLQRLSGIHVYYHKSTCTCYKLTLLIDLINFIGNYGGVMSISFGGSIMTLVELSYLIIKFFIHNITYWSFSKFLNW